MVNKMWMKYRGEGKTHTDMNLFVFDLMKELGYFDVKERQPTKHQDDNSDNEWIARPEGWYHESDVHGAQILHHKNGKKYYYHTFVEIDGEWHDNKIQKNKDETSEQMIKEFYKAYPHLGKYRIIRIKKAVVLGAMKTGNTAGLKNTLALVVAK